MKQLGAFIALIFEVLISGFLLSHVYNWFIPEAFGVSAITFSGGCGIMMVFSFLTASKGVYESEYDSVMLIFIRDISIYLLTFVIAFIIKCIFSF